MKRSCQGAHGRQNSQGRTTPRWRKERERERGGGRGREREREKEREREYTYERKSVEMKCRREMEWDTLRSGHMEISPAFKHAMHQVGSSVHRPAYDTHILCNVTYITRWDDGIVLLGINIGARKQYYLLTWMNPINNYRM